MNADQQWWATTTETVVHLMERTGDDPPRWSRRTVCGLLLHYSAVTHDQSPPGEPCQLCRMAFEVDNAEQECVQRARREEPNLEGSE